MTNQFVLFDDTIFKVLTGMDFNNSVSLRPIYQTSRLVLIKIGSRSWWLTAVSQNLILGGF